MQAFKSIANFNCLDPKAGVPLETVWPLSQRAYILMLRNRTRPALQSGFLNVMGAIEMLEGLEYHHDNVLNLSQHLANGEAVEEACLYHEAVAYVNRLGQFYYFARSRLVSQAVGNPLGRIPTILKFMPFRMKYSAHRSIDAPCGETENTQILQAMSLSSAVGRMMTLKPGAMNVLPPPSNIVDSAALDRFRQQLWQNNYVTFQLFDEDAQTHLNLTVEKEHPIISVEAYELLATVILWEPTTTGSSRSDPSLVA
jgi:hypothetical protein